MKLREVQTHPNGESLSPHKKPGYLALDAKLAVDTFGSRVHVEWDPQSDVTSLGQLPFGGDSKELIIH